jgi:hypothetical protein
MSGSTKKGQLMDLEAVKHALKELLSVSEEAYSVSKTAAKNRQSLSGDNFYGNKFHALIVKLSQLETKLHPIADRLLTDASDKAKFISRLEILRSVDAVPAQKAEAYKTLSLVCHSKLSPVLESMAANPVPATEQVLPLAVVRNTRRYLEIVVLQANGCYEHQWFDACSVMIRKLIEILIIEVYEARGGDAEIKDPNGDFLMLSKLVDKILAEKSWNLARDTKRALPMIKSLGDHSAHNRRYVSTRDDVDKILPGLRVIADDLLHLARLK